MHFHLESPRLYFRPLVAEDDIYLFELDSNPEVHTYLGKNPVTDIQQVRDVITNIRWQYEEFSMGRMAAIIKETEEFIGWAGLKREHSLKQYGIFTDLGYRFMPRYWGKGYATEAAKAFVDYGFNVLKLEKINAWADFDNHASRKVLEKAGLNYVEDFDYEGDKEVWYEMLNPTANASF